MKCLICVLCVCNIINTTQADCEPSTQEPSLLRLQKTLLCGYDKTEMPFLNLQNQFQDIYIMFIPKYIDFDDSKNFIQLSTVIYLRWHDNSLKWTSSDYDGLVYVPMKAESIWLPDLRILNSKLIDGNINTRGESIVMLKYDGTVHYATPSLLGVHCTADWTNWPFDKHVCNFTITSELIYRRVNLEDKKIDVRMEKFIHSHEWKLLHYEFLKDVKYNQKDHNQDEVFLTIRFTIQRHSAVLASSYITPAVAMIVFSLGLLLIEPSNSDRLTIISLMLILQCLYLQYLAYKIPSNGDKNPKIVNFFASSLFMTGLLCIQTLLLILMPSWMSKPAWLQTVLDTACSNSLLRVLFLSGNNCKKGVQNTADASNEEGSVISPNDTTEKQWKMFANVVNRLTFLLLLLFYVICIILCVLL